MKLFCGLLLSMPLLVLSAPLDLTWTTEKLLIAGQRSRLPHQPQWPEKQTDFIAYSMTGVLPDGIYCQLELRLQDELLLSLPCTKRYVLERPLRITPAMRLELYLHNTNLFSPGEEVVLRNRVSLDVAP
ncbi:hypothetical protein Rhein_3435 [Rheinheimera sp. A13L]|uniref:hypothetical protein n=1 Tax=Rheinheimera sp. A13L TaxID=506534 RepID=UPI0002124ACD|nr:hypothetical protein [Rheinheimera sp. A13L]EGM76373.1 hypothetical protein Rhein_3435 [Rheinheimera sp. A13L]